MKIETALNRRNTAASRLRDLYSMARYGGMLAKDMDSEKRKLFSEILRGCPYWVNAYLDGYEKALRDELYRDSLMFGGFYDGVFYSTHRDRDDYYEKHGVEPAEYADNGKVTARGHYWKTTATPKPYFIDGKE